ncbi:MAG: hypothetical protein IJK26_04540 [Clostridia bacterium]|nr:hypothetical protein [Clostridia bacterium]
MGKIDIKTKINAYREEEFKIRLAILNELEGKSWKKGIWVADFCIDKVKNGAVWSKGWGIYLTTDELISLYYKSIM